MNGRQGGTSQRAGNRAPSPAETALSLNHVSKLFGGVHALDDVSFEVDVGEVHCLAGENGSGKSTLIKIVTGVYAPEPGTELNIFGQRRSSISPPQARALGISVIWQDLALFPHMSVFENICFDELVGVIPRFTFTGSMRNRAFNVLGQLGVTLDLDARLNTLPIAQRQVVAIARALMGDTRLIFMDEPTASLTQQETDHLLGIVRTLSAQGVAIVFVSHRLAEVLEIATRVSVLRDGKLVGVFPTQGMTQLRLGQLMTGMTLDPEKARVPIQSSEPVLQLDQFSRSGEFENITLSVHKGEVLGITGLIGAGRTELAKAVIGVTQADSGSIHFLGRSVELKSIRDAIQAGIAYVPEDRLSLGLVQPQSIADNTCISVIDKILNLFGIISETKKTNLVSHWIDKLGVKTGQAQDPVSTLSGGNQQKVVLAKWLATEPVLLILDSPTVGVDVGARAGIFSIVRDLADAGLAILLISDEVSEVLYNSDRVLHMADGKIKGEFHPATVSAAELEQQIYA